MTHTAHPHVANVNILELPCAYACAYLSSENQALKIPYIPYLEYNFSVIKSVCLLFLLLFTCLFPTEFLNIDKYPHKFWNSKGWMCVIQLNGNLTNKL